MPPALGGPQGYTPPEGGWGWAVVVGAFISIGFSYAFPKSITVFFKDIEVIFNATPSQVSWISSIMLAVMYAGGEWCLCCSASPPPSTIILKSVKLSKETSPSRSVEAEVCKHCCYLTSISSSVS